jgi:A/G-specific adenine glycosylase
MHCIVPARTIFAVVFSYVHTFSSIERIAMVKTWNHRTVQKRSHRNAAEVTIHIRSIQNNNHDTQSSDKSFIRQRKSLRLHVQKQPQDEGEICSFNQNKTLSQCEDVQRNHRHPKADDTDTTTSDPQVNCPLQLPVPVPEPVNSSVHDGITVSSISKTSLSNTSTDDSSVNDRTPTSASSTTTTQIESKSGPETSLLDAFLNHTDVSFHYFTPQEANQIQSKLLDWYATNRRKLPWRGDPPPWNGSTSSTTTHSTRHKNEKSTQKDAKLSCTNASTRTKETNESYMHQTYPITTYGVWVSEIMCQQTRVEAVIIKWCQFMSKFPNVTSLAQANLEDVNAIWAGLGYYRRLKLLHTAAQTVVTKYDGTIPNTVTELLSLPGIGRYTANAIASIAYQQCVPVVDGNVGRVLSRLRCIAQTIKAPSVKDQYGWTLAQQIVSAQGTDNMTSRAGDINQALMELGATYCSPSGTGIHPNDPLKEFYWSTKLGMQLASSLRNRKDTITTTSIETATTNLDHYMSIVDTNDNNTTRCQVCASSGIHDIVKHFGEKMLSISDMALPHDDPNLHDKVQQLGHSLFPLAPLKVHKKEDLYIVAAMCRTHTDANGRYEEQWLLMKRPENGGLLSGQWEFPSTCVWQSEEVKRKSSGARLDMSSHVPLLSITERQNHACSLMSSLGGHVDGTNLTLLTVNEEPMHHIFSHVRHTMYIEYTRVDDKWIISSTDPTRTTTVQWMSQSDMDHVGITSGVKKIFTAVQKRIADGIIPSQKMTKVRTSDQEKLRKPQKRRVDTELENNKTKREKTRRKR